MSSRIADRLRGLMRETSSPHQIALGFTLGLALSMIPVPFLGFALGLGAAALVRANLVAAYLGSAVMNPLTGPFIFFAEMWIGLTLAGQPVPSYAAVRELSAMQWLEMLQTMLAPFAMGIGIMIFVSVALGYPFAFAAAKVLRRKYAPDQGLPAPSASNGTSSGV